MTNAVQTPRRFALPVAIAHPSVPANRQGNPASRDTNPAVAPFARDYGETWQRGMNSAGFGSRQRILRFQLRDDLSPKEQDDSGRLQG